MLSVCLREITNPALRLGIGLISMTPLAETSEVIFQGLSLSKVFKKKAKTGVKIELLDVNGDPHASVPPSEEDVSEHDDDLSGQDETETIRHEGFGASPQKMLKTEKTLSSSSSSSSSSGQGAQPDKSDLDEKATKGKRLTAC